MEKRDLQNKPTKQPKKLADLYLGKVAGGQDDSNPGGGSFFGRASWLWSF